MITDAGAAGLTIAAMTSRAGVDPADVQRRADDLVAGTQAARAGDVLISQAVYARLKDAIVETLLEVGRIELRNFGVFEVRQRKARKARNPRTGAEVMVPSKNVVTFKAGKIMEEKIENTKPASSAAPISTPNASATVGS